MKYLFTLVICIVSCAVQATPGPSPSKLAKLHEMLDSMHFSETITQDRAICVQEYVTGVFSPEKVAKDKGNFRGFKPDTPEWPKVIAAYKAFAEKSCSYYVPERFEQPYIQFYDSRLSESDLDAYLAFQKTPAALHMAAATHDAVAFLADAFKNISEPVLKDANDQLTASLQNICTCEPWYKKIFCYP